MSFTNKDHLHFPFQISVLIMQENMLFSREICTAGKKNSGKSSLNLNEDLEKVASGPLGNVSFQP